MGTVEDPDAIRAILAAVAASRELADRARRWPRRWTPPRPLHSAPERGLGAARTPRLVRSPLGPVPSGPLRDRNPLTGRCPRCIWGAELAETCIWGAEPSVDQSRCGLEGQELPRRGVYVSYAPHGGGCGGGCRRRGRSAFPPGPPRSPPRGAPPAPPRRGGA